MNRPLTPPTEAEQREQYALTGLARVGIPFERAMQSEAVVIAINGGIQARRRRQARQDQANPIQYQCQNQEAA